MQRLNLYKYSAITLLLLNMVLVFLLFQSRQKSHPRMGHRHHTATAIMKLDQEQDQLFLADARAHGTKMDSISNMQLKLLQPYFQTLVIANGKNQVDKDSLLIQFQYLEKIKIESTYQHFEYIKTILKPNQMEGYKEFVQKILNKILVKDKKSPPPKQDKRK